MGKGSKRVKSLVPPGKAPMKAGSAPVTSLKLARKLTSKFHLLLGDQQRVQNDTTLGDVARKDQLAEIVTKMDEIGGRDSYQRASVLSQSAAMKSARYLFKTLARFHLQPIKGDAQLRVLEVGAINAQISSVPWLHVRAVDLMSQHPKVEQRDFFKVPVGSGPGRGKGAASTGSGLSSAAVPALPPPTVADRDSIIAPTASRLRRVDWVGIRAAAERAGIEARAGEGTEEHSDAESEGEGDVDMQQVRGRGSGIGSSTSNGISGKGGVGNKRPRPDSTGPKGGQDRTGLSRHGSSIIFLPIPSRPAPAAIPLPANTVYVCPHRRCSPSYSPQSGGYDIVVCAMVINCVPEAHARTELLLRCRDHLVPGGLLYLSLPSRCLDVSQHLTRDAFEGLLSACGFVLRDAKMTPKISFYMLQRCDVVSFACDLQPAPPGITSSGSCPPSVPFLYGAGGGPPASVAPVQLAQGGEGAGYGASWVPRLVASCPQETSLLVSRLNPPLRMLPLSLLPVTGFTRTEFGLTVPGDWVLSRPPKQAKGAGDAAAPPDAGRMTTVPARSSAPASGRPSRAPVASRTDEAESKPRPAKRPAPGPSAT